MEVKANKMHRTCLKSTIVLPFSLKIICHFFQKNDGKQQNWKNKQHEQLILMSMNNMWIFTFIN